MAALTISILGLEVLSSSLTQEKKPKASRLGKKGNCLLTDNMIFYKMLRSQQQAKNLLERIRYKINTQKSNLFLHITDEQAKNKIKKAISFKIADKRIKYLGINLTK